MERKNYIQPATEVVMMHVENLMLTVSNGGGTPPDDGPAHIRRGTCIPD